MKTLLPDDALTYHLNEAALGEASSIKEERKLIRDRLEKLDASKNGVSDAVYQRVRSDYLGKLDKTSEQLLTLKKNLEEEQKNLLSKKKIVESNLKEHREKMEEAELRHSLGEFKDQEYQEVIETETNEVGRLEKALKGFHEGLERHKNLFEGEIFSAKETPKHEPIHESTHYKDHSEEMATDYTARVSVEAQTSLNSVPPSPSAPGSSKRTGEILVLKNGQVVQTIPLDKTLQIGRSPSNDIVLNEPKVSRKHAEIHCAAGKHIILDLESSNGTYVSGKRITEQLLKPNDEITIGNTKMVFKI